MLNSPQHSPGFQTLFPCRSRQGIIIVRSQSFSGFRVIITLFDVINEPRLKTEPVLFVFEIYIEKSSYYQMVTLQSINAGFRTAILDFT